ncbi:MAG: alpha/beta hydrolase [Rhodococcus sp. (in: high G+C Gram-positive bacteria)]|uniref:alpha/beta fold hydrolase n=1 Tax=Rhodococcus sp. TaxID=1831 RepID=UPI002AD80CBE|nr:alpha/beta hydrolase [Rhodococcus sp. (in: high G+C Gram-positive bacteria)]
MNHLTPQTSSSTPTPPQLESGFRCPGDELQLHTAARKLLLTWSLPWELRRVHTSLGNTVILTTGTASPLPPVVLVPGAGLSAATMEAAVTEIASTRKVFVVDVPGEPGMSAARRPASADLAHYGDWLDEVTDALGERSIVLIGHALGAAIVLSSTPHSRVAGTVLVNPERLSRSGWNAWGAARRFLWRRSTDIDAAQHYLEHITGPHFVPSAALVTWFCNVGAYCHPTPSRPLLGKDRIDIWTRHTPVTAVVGTDDPLAPRRTVNRVFREHPVSMVELSGAGHLAPVEHPSHLAHVLREHELLPRRPAHGQ